MGVAHGWWKWSEEAVVRVAVEEEEIWGQHT